MTAILAFLAAALCLLFLWKNIQQRQEAAMRYEQLREEDIQEEKENETDVSEEAERKPAVSGEAETETDAEKKTTLDIPVDFKKLESVNADIYAWLRVPGTNIDYPVVQSRTDDTFYAAHGVKI